jgi:small-conductance mechanosensitive channel
MVAQAPAPETHARDETVKRELAKVTGKPTPRVRLRSEKRHKIRLLIYVVAALLFAGLYAAIRAGTFDFLGKSALPLAERVARGLFLAAIVLAVSKAAGLVVLGWIEDRASRFNVERVRALLTALVVAGITVTSLFADWRTTFMSLGLASLVLGFALQAPITSFLGWIYILVRQPYRVGDRVQIGEAKGDVIDVSYLDTTLWECGGPMLSSDHPSGRVIKFPNSAVLNETVYNYSWPLFPYVWNEVTIQIGYGADLDFVAKAMRECAEEELGKDMHEWVEKYKALLAKTPVDEVQVKEQPVVLFRVSNNTWVEATARYLVLPRRAGTVRSRLLVKILERLNKAPEKALLPKADMR